MIFLKTGDMKNVGIWIDSKKAIIVFLKDDKETFKIVHSEVEDYRPSGGSGTRLKGGPQDVVQDSKYLERQKHQFKSYFKELAGVIKGADAIALFGPADTAEKFKKELNVNYKSLAAKVKAVAKADSMTDNQIKAMVKDFFQTSK